MLAHVARETLISQLEVANEKIGGKNGGHGDGAPLVEVDKDEGNGEDTGEHGMDEEGEVAEGEGHKATQAVQVPELADVDDEDVDLDSGGEDVAEGEEHGDHGDAQRHHLVVIAVKFLVFYHSAVSDTKRDVFLLKRTPN